MRIASLAWPVFAIATYLAAGCGIEQLTQGGSSGSTGTVADGGGDSGGDAGVTGAGCGIESGSGAQLCVATSLCPNVVVDTQALPHCGFRIKGGSSELVCACGESICAMGAFATCAQAAALLQSQTEASVCTQVADGRCFAGTPSSSGSSGSNTKPTCDRQCLQECGGGGGCASICGC
jgi:hypothetical protein